MQDICEKMITMTLLFKKLKVSSPETPRENHPGECAVSVVIMLWCFKVY
jgi:hypothetical protein